MYATISADVVSKIKEMLINIISQIYYQHFFLYLC